MTDNDIKELINSNELSVIEDAISSKCKTYVNKEFIDFTIGVLRREISNSRLPIEYIQQLLRVKKHLIIEFGVQLFNTLRGAPLEDEYYVKEKIPKSERPKFLGSHGLGIGFGIKYAIYWHFLETDPKGLLEFIEKERIPQAQKFCRTLRKIYDS